MVTPQEEPRGPLSCECVDLIVGRDNLGCRPESTLGWPGRPKGGCPVKGTGDPGDYIKVEAWNPGRRN